MKEINYILFYFLKKILQKYVFCYEPLEREGEHLWNRKSQWTKQKETKGKR